MGVTLLSPAATRDAAIARLRRLAQAEGGWSYRDQGFPQAEPTALALFALHAADPAGASLEPSLSALESWQLPDGSFRVKGGYPKSIWPTAFAALALARLKPQAAALPRAVRLLLHAVGNTIAQTEENRRDFDIDPSLRGWPWVEGTFSWVEPTAWVALALRAAGQGDHPRVREGLKLLLDRAYDEGGINYGNRRVFGRPTEPVPGDTAAFLLAFVGEPDQPKLAAARRYLRKVCETNPDLENVCWAKIALDAWADQDQAAATASPETAERIALLHAEREERTYLDPSVVREALVALALSPRTAFRPEAPLAALSLGATPAAKKAGWSERLSSRFRGLMVKAVGSLRPVTVPAAIHIAKADSYEEPLADILWAQYAGFRTAVPLKDQRIVLKPNMVEYHPDKVINTNPKVVDAVIELCKREGAKEIIVAEGPGHWRNTEYLLTASGLGAVLQKHGVRFVDLNHDNPVETPNLGRCTPMENLYLAETIANADLLISLPKLKTHHWAGVTLSLKNLFGTMPGQCYGWPKNELHWNGIDNSIVDIALTRMPALAIVDGIIGMEGDGPLNGEAKFMGVLVMGADLLAVDATCTRLMGLAPEKVGHLALAEQRRVGVLKEKDIAQLSHAIASLRKPFEPHPRFAGLKAAPDASSASPSS